jgi:uncharacterized protein
MSFLAGALWTLLALVLMGLASGAAQAGREDVYLDLVTLATCRVLASSLTLFAILRLHAPEGSIRAVLALKTPRLVHVALAVVLGAALLPVMSYAGDLLAARFPPTPEETEAIERLFVADTAAKKVAIVAAAGVVLPLVDELFFRGALFTLLVRSGRRFDTAVFVVAAYEVLVGGTPRAVLATAVPVLAFTWIRGLTGSVLPSIAARITYFSLSVLPLALGRDEPKLPLPAVVGCGLAAAAALSVLVLVRTRDVAAPAEP